MTELAWVKSLNTQPPGTLRNTAEGQTNGTTLTAANSGGGSGDAFDAVTSSGTTSKVFSTTQAMHGNQSYAISTSASSVYFVSYEGKSDSSAAQQMYLYLTAYPSGWNAFMTMYPNATKASLVITNTGGVVALDAGGVKATSAASTAPLNTWLRLDLVGEVGTTTSNGRIAVKLSTGDSPTSLYSYDSGATANLGTVNITKYWYGKPDSVPSLTTCYIDDIGYAPNVTTFLPPVY